MRILVATLVSFGTWLLASFAHAVELNPGDIVVASGSAGLVRVDPATGAKETISIGGDLQLPVDVVVGDDGVLFVTDLFAETVFAVDAATGEQTPLVTGLVGPGGIVLDSNGVLLFENTDLLGGADTIFEVDTGTGASEPFFTGAVPSGLRGLAVEASDDLVSAEAVNDVVLRFDRQTGSQTTLPTPAINLIQNPQNLDVDPNDGTIFLVDLNANALIAINPVSGAQTIVSQDQSFSVPQDVAVEASGDLIVVGGGINGVLRVDRSTGLQSFVTTGIFGSGVAVVVPELGSAGSSAWALGTLMLIARRHRSA